MNESVTMKSITRLIGRDVLLVASLATWAPTLADDHTDENVNERAALLVEERFESGRGVFAATIGLNAETDFNAADGVLHSTFSSSNSLQRREAPLGVRLTDADNWSLKFDVSNIGPLAANTGAQIGLFTAQRDASVGAVIVSLNTHSVASQTVRFRAFGFDTSGKRIAATSEILRSRRARVTITLSYDAATRSLLLSVQDRQTSLRRTSWGAVRDGTFALNSFGFQNRPASYIKANLSADIDNVIVSRKSAPGHFQSMRPRVDITQQRKDRGAIMIAHRGGPWFDYPENTWAIFAQSVASKVGWIELDTVIASDGTLLVCHDIATDRITGVMGRLDKMSAPQIAELDAGAHKGPRFCNSRIPELRDVLELFRGRAGFVFDIKTTEVLEPLIDLLKELDLIDQSMILVGWNKKWNGATAVSELKKTTPELFIMAGFDFGVPANWIKPKQSDAWGMLKHAGADGVCIRMSLTVPEHIEAAHAAGLLIFNWESNARWPALVDAGLDGWLTDDAEKARQTAKEKGIQIWDTFK